MKFHAFFILAIIALFANSISISAQADSVIGQLTNSAANSFASSISGDGRLVVFESDGNLATENPRNADGNREIFLFDYAQRRIFQITDTKSLRNDLTLTFNPTNIKVIITNERPVISNNGRWIAFSSNATTSTPTAPNTTNPGSFDAEAFNPVAPATTPNPLLADGNTEIWFYQVPALATVNLSAGDELPVTALTGGAFTRVTNTAPSRLPFPGSSSNLPIIADDNRSGSITDDGSYIAFTSNRDLVPDTVTGGNASPNANDEIFTYSRSLNRLNQITLTTRGTIVEPILNQSPTISGFSNGLLRVAFTSNANKPITGIVESNTDNNFEVFYVDLDPANGSVSATGAKKQITVTARVGLGDIVNVLDFGKRMSRDGRYIAFDSYADLQNENSGTNYPSFALYVYDLQFPLPTARRVGPRSDADATATTVGGGDVPHFPGFTDTDANGTPSTLVLDTRLNIAPAGTVSATNDGGLNPDSTRPAQIYAYPLNVAAANARFVRLTKFPTLTSSIPSIQPITTNSVSRMTFSLGFTEIGTGNNDLNSEAYYLLIPLTTVQTVGTTTYSTGASLIPVSPSPVPTPTPGPTPSPTPTPTGTPSPTPTPTPQTPIAVQGVSPGMLVNLTFNPNVDRLFTARTAVGSLSRSFTLPIELSGVTMTINGVSVGLKSVRKGQIVFVVPRGLTATLTGTTYPVIITNNGIAIRGTITIVPTRPDIFTFSQVPAPNGRARLFNITNTVFRTEPFNVTTLRLRGGRRVPTVLRLFLTGVEGVPLNNAAVPVIIRIRDVNISPTTAAVLREPGVYSFDFTLPPSLLGAGDVPVVFTITVGGVTFNSRLDDTAPRVRIL